MSMHASLYTIDEIDEEIASWKAALKACATGKSYTIDGSTLTRQDIGAIRDHLAWLMRMRQSIAGSSSAAFVRPLFRR